MAGVIGTPTNDGYNAAASSHTANLPSGIQAGEVLCIAVYLNDKDRGVSSTGFTAKEFSFPTGGEARMVLLYKEATGLEGATATLSVTPSGTAAATISSFRLEGYDASDFLNGDNAASLVTSNSSTPSIPASSLSLASGSGCFVMLACEASRNVVSFDADFDTEVSSTASTNSMHTFLQNSVSGTGNPQYDFTMSDARAYDVALFEFKAAGASGPATRDITLNGEATHDTVQVMLATSNVTDGESVLAPSILNQAPEDNMQYYAPKSVNGMNITWASDGTFTTDADQTETIRVYFWSPAASQWGATDLTITQTTVTPGDTTPNAFSFTDVTGAPLSTVVESDTISVLGVDVATDIPVTIVGGEYAVDTGAGFGGFTSTGTNVQLGYDIKVRGTSSGSFSTPVDVTLTVGGVSDTFTITTVADIAVIVGGDTTGLSLGLGLSL